MSAAIVTRSPADRLRHTLMFEVCLLGVLAPLMAYLAQKPIMDTGILTVMLAVKAMVLTVVFNYCFDKIDVHYGRIPNQRSFRGRVIHAITSELFLSSTSLPLLMWWLDLGLLEAILMDVIMIGAVMIYTFIFNWAYDRLFPVVQPAQQLTPAA